MDDLTIRKGNDLSVAKFPGQEVMLGLIPVDFVISGLIKQVERTSEKVMGGFDPYEPTLGIIFYESIKELGKWSSRGLKFGNWHYEFVPVFDSQNEILRFEVLAVRQFFPVRICLLDCYIDSFNPGFLGLDHKWSSSLGTRGLSPREFIDLMYQNLRDVNDKISDWNSFCEIRKPYFDQQLPVPYIIGSIMPEVRVTARYGSSSLGMVEMIHVLRCFDRAEETTFGPWEFKSEYHESGDFVWLRHILRNAFADDLAFIIKPEKVYLAYELMEDIHLEDFVIETIWECSENMSIWNRLLDGQIGGALSGKPFGY